MNMANTELEAINRQIATLKRERKALNELRNAKIEAFRLKFGNAPAKFSAEHPIISEIAKGTATAPIAVGNAIANYAAEPHPLLAKIGARIRAKIERGQSNTAFSKTLQPGQEALNPQTDQFIKRTEDGYSYTARPRRMLKA